MITIDAAVVCVLMTIANVYLFFITMGAVHSIEKKLDELILARVMEVVNDSNDS